MQKGLDIKQSADTFSDPLYEYYECDFANFPWPLLLVPSFNLLLRWYTTDTRAVKRSTDCTPYAHLRDRAKNKSPLGNPAQKTDKIDGLFDFGALL